MRTTACQRCARVLPIGETYRVFDVTPLCEGCGDAELAALNQKKVPAGSVVKNADPTICAQCETDWGSSELPKLAQMPMCDPCTAKARNYPFPAWVKASFAAVLALVAVSFYVNARYFAGFVEIKRGMKQMQSGNVDDADVLVAKAADHVPEAGDLRRMATFVHAVNLLNHDKSAEAEELLAPLQAPAGMETIVSTVFLRAKIGAAFDRKDYDAFLASSQDLLKANPKEAFAYAGVASAYACKYAVTGKEEFKTASLENLAKAKAMEAGGELPEYVARIEHRLATREILSKAEYDRRFPAKGSR